MAELLIFIGIAGLIVAGIVAWKLLETAMKAFFFILTIVMVVLIVLGFFVVQDARNFSETFNNSTSVFLLQHSREVIAGFSMDNSMPKAEALLMDTAMLSAASSQYSALNLDAIKGDAFKVFVFSLSGLSNDTSLSVNLNDQEIPQSVISAILSSEEPIGVYADWYAGAYGGSAQAMKLSLGSEFDSSSFKGRIFALALAEKMGNPLFLINKYKEGSLEVYPKTAMFSFLDYFPVNFINKVAKESIKELNLSAGSESLSGLKDRALEAVK